MQKTVAANDDEDDDAVDDDVDDADVEDYADDDAGDVDDDVDDVDDDEGGDEGGGGGEEGMLAEKSNNPNLKGGEQYTFTKKLDRKQAILSDTGGSRRRQ